MPGIAVHLVPGHTQGLQVVCIETSEGPVVLASDALHFYASLREGKPFTVATDPMQKLQGYAEVQKLAGHDPEVMCFYPDRAGHPDIARIFGKSAVVLAEAEPRKFPVTKGLTP